MISNRFLCAGFKSTSVPTSFLCFLRMTHPCWVRPLIAICSSYCSVRFHLKSVHDICTYINTYIYIYSHIMYIHIYTHQIWGTHFKHSELQSLKTHFGTPNASILFTTSHDFGVFRLVTFTYPTTSNIAPKANFSVM